MENHKKEEDETTVHNIPSACRGREVEIMDETAVEFERQSAFTGNEVLSPSLCRS